MVRPGRGETHRWFPVFAPLLLLSRGLAAQSADPLEQMSLEDLLNIKVTSAAKMEQTTSEAPGVVSVVTREQIQAYGWNSLNDVLYHQPGFGPSQDFDRRTVGSRGLFEGWNNNHLLLLVDGVPVNDNLYGTAYTSEVTSLLAARSVEIIRGPGSALYGSNATNGVIQINTVSAEDLGIGEAQIRVGDNGVRMYDAIVGRKGTLVSAVVAYSSYETNGNIYASRDGSGRLDAAGAPRAFTTRDERSSQNVWVKLDGRGPLEGLSLQYHDQRWRFQTGHGWLWWIPDVAEPMTEKRQLFSLIYKPKVSGPLAPEVTARYQRHQIDWSQRYYPNGALDGYYPAGMWEYLKTDASDLLVRGQATYRLPKGATALAAVEIDRFLYSGDSEHASNVDVDGAGSPPFPGGRTEPLGPWLDYILDQPLLNVGVLGQVATGGLLGERLKVTGGLRYDRLSFDFARIKDAGRPTRSMSFSQVSPRVAVVFAGAPGLALKLLAGRAFRAPAPTELAGAHTFSLGSNISALRPEVITTYELACEWNVTKSLTWRTNVYRNSFDNQIAYSVQANNLVANVYSLSTAGLETELLFSAGPVSGFVSYSYSRRLSEEILDATIAPSDGLTWMPAHMASFGIRAGTGGFTAALSGRLQGRVERRDSDVGVKELPLGVGVTLDLDRYRPRSVPGFLTADLKVAYRIPKGPEVSLQLTNLLDKDYSLVKVGPFPFDYRQEGRRVVVSGRYPF